MSAPLPLRIFFAAVWLVNGLWCKVFDAVPRHREIVAQILGGEHALLLTRLIGIGEVLLAAWILSGIRWKWSCALQIVLVAAMNIIEFIMAPDLLLFGRINSLVALAYIMLVAWAGFRPRKPSLLRPLSLGNRSQPSRTYDPAKHTEISIRRARHAQPPSPDTRSINTAHIPLADATLDRALLILAAHEIRDHNERVAFFRELQRVLAPEGRVIVTEHLRDFTNIAAYSIGAWHFHPRSEWLATFHAAGFRGAREFRNNLLITTFILEPEVNPS